MSDFHRLPRCHAFIFNYIYILHLLRHICQLNCSALVCLDYCAMARRLSTNLRVFTEKGCHLHTNWLPLITNFCDIREKGCPFRPFWLPAQSAYEPDPLFQRYSVFNSWGNIWVKPDSEKTLPSFLFNRKVASLIDLLSM